jgi:hypothetical protein
VQYFLRELHNLLRHRFICDIHETKEVLISVINLCQVKDRLMGLLLMLRGGRGENTAAVANPDTPSDVNDAALAYVILLFTDFNLGANFLLCIDWYSFRFLLRSSLTTLRFRTYHALFWKGSLVWCPGHNKRIAPLSFFHGCRKRD